jgi:2-polyprenyl-6-methoxyphenol hydroxylase-like FAD-dependent oxidoreductase
MTRVVISGGAFAGLAGALFLARRGHTVTVVERDEAPPGTTADDDARLWQHRGAPQARQTHALLGRARRVLVDEAPDVVEALLNRGVHEIEVAFGAGRLDGERMLLSRRLVAEAELRRTVAREPGVTMRVGDPVVGLQVSRAGDVPIVTGVRLSSGELLAADLVVDAGGRRSALPSWFATAGLRSPVDEHQDCGFFYLTRYYRVRPGCSTPQSRVPASIALDYATVLALGADNDTFSVTMTLSVNDPYRKVFRHPDRFEAFLRAVPHSAPWIHAGEPISEISMMSNIENRRRRLVDKDGPIAGGIVAIGDAALHTNPTLGRGVSMAVWHAQHLAEVAHTEPDDPGAFVGEFSTWTDDQLGTWYDTQVAADSAALERLDAGLAGIRLPPSANPKARFAAGAFACAQNDAVVASAVAGVVHLLATPAAAFGDPDVAGRIEAFLATGVSLERPPDAPNRAMFESLATA